MTDKEARDLIERDIRLKMLGPGFAEDIYLCQPDGSDEIIPQNPKYAYSTGILIPQSADEFDEQQRTEESNIPMDNNYIDEWQDSNDKEYPNQNLDDQVNNEDNDVNKTDLVENPDDSSSDKRFKMRSHIGLIACVPSSIKTFNLDITYGTYKKLDWNQQVEKVKVKVGRYISTIKETIEKINQDESIQKLVHENNAPNFSDWFIIDEEAKIIFLKPELRNLFDKKHPFEKFWLPKISGFDEERNFLEFLLRPFLFKREHHIHNITLSKDTEAKLTPDDNVSLSWENYDSHGMKFLKVLLRNTGKQPIFQPTLSVRLDNGSFQSFTEPASVLENDEEYRINEFLYRGVKNYGKGVNCAVEWDKEGKTIQTTFIPSAEIEKYSNDVKESENANSENLWAIKEACKLINISKWSGKDDNQIFYLLESFIKGYENWHSEQDIEAKRINGFDDEKRIILSRQKELLDRLKENLDYLKTHPEALECFKIANSAMLIQMVVAKHPKFKKNTQWADLQGDNLESIYNDLSFFSNQKYSPEMGEPAYRPFQLAFLLMNVKSTFDLADPYRDKIVDLIWFPTGGGKTEAYLALTALTIIHRRKRGQDKGVSVIMRYTLRLLTSQQFERASYLICALEFLRNKIPDWSLGRRRITIGIYVGGGVTPNKVEDLKAQNGKYRRFYNNPEGYNPFPASYCPWCGVKLVSKLDNNEFLLGYILDGSINCINGNCHFGDQNTLPVNYIDENIYQTPPTLLFATVDKFAQLYKQNAKNLLYPGVGIDSPDLIIQDELHLIVGALGSIVGLFELIVEELINKKGRKVKIIASTATTRNTTFLIEKLYNREVRIFPAMGLTYDDNYFSHVVSGAKRRHIGIMPADIFTSAQIESKLSAFMLLARVKVFKKYIEDLSLDWRKPDDVDKACDKYGFLATLLDNYWTYVYYYNSKKDLGRSKSRVAQEMMEQFRSHKYLYMIPASLSIVKDRFDQRVLELTGRIDSSQIKDILTKAESKVSVRKDDKHILHISKGYDIVFATNMISVGIDISRWNVMMMVGQPRSNSEYIQSSSRVARNTYGLVVNYLNPNRIREHSLFENYTSFHASYYKSVEPLSITPLTYATIDHPAFLNMVEIFRDYILGNRAADIEDIAEDFAEIISNRFGVDQNSEFYSQLNDAVETFANKLDDDNIENEFAKSLREIAPDVFAQIL